MWLPEVVTASEGPHQHGALPPPGDDSQGPSPCSTASSGEVLVCDAAIPSPGAALLLPLGGIFNGPPQRVGSPQYPFTQSMSPANAGDKRKLVLPFFSVSRQHIDGDTFQGDSSVPSSTNCSPTNRGPLCDAAAALLRRRLTTGFESHSPHRGMRDPSPVLEGDEGGAPLSAFTPAVEWAPSIEGLLAPPKHGGPVGSASQSPRSLLWPKQEQQQQPHEQAATAPVDEAEAVAGGETKEEQKETKEEPQDAEVGPQGPSPPIHIPVSSTFTVTEETDLPGSSESLLSHFGTPADPHHQQQQQQQWAAAADQTACISGAPPLLPSSAAAATGAAGCCASNLPSQLMVHQGPSTPATSDPHCLQQQQQQDLLLRHAKVPRLPDTSDATTTAGSTCSSEAAGVSGSSGCAATAGPTLAVGAAGLYPRDDAADSLFQHPTPAFIDYCIRKHLPTNPNPDNLPGIQLERQQKRWCASVYFRGNQFKKRFSSGRWGTLGAFYAAIEWRQVQCRKFQKLKSAGAPMGALIDTGAHPGGDREGTAAAAFLQQQQLLQQQQMPQSQEEASFLGSPASPSATAAAQQQQQLEVPSAVNLHPQQNGDNEARSPSPSGAPGPARPRRKASRRRTWEQQQPSGDPATETGGTPVAGLSPHSSVSSPCMTLLSPVRSNGSSRRRPSPRRVGVGALRGIHGGGPSPLDEDTDLSSPPPGDEAVQWREGFRLPFGTEGRNQLLRRLRQLYHADVPYWSQQLEANRISFSRVPFATVPELWKIAHVMGCFGFALHLSRKFAGGASARAVAQQQQQQQAAAAAAAHQRAVQQQQGA